MLQYICVLFHSLFLFYFVLLFALSGSDYILFAIFFSSLTQNHMAEACTAVSIAVHQLRADQSLPQLEWLSIH